MYLIVKYFIMIKNEIKHSLILTESEKRRIIKSINEALAVNDSLVNKTDEIYKEFLSELKQTDFQYTYSQDFKAGMVVFSRDFFGADIRFEFRCCNILNKDRFEEISDHYQLGNAFFNVNKALVCIYVALLSGSLKTNVKSLLQHELEHAYQLIHGKTLNSKVGKDSYAKAYKLLRDGTDSETELKVAYIIYTQTDSETDAFANQLYQDLSTEKNLSPDEVLKNSTIYTYYKNSRKLLREIKFNREKFEADINNFGYSYDRFMNLFTKLNRRTINKIGKILTRYNEENQPTDVVMNRIRTPKDI